MSIADRTSIIRAGLGVAVKAAAAVGLLACGLSPSGDGPGDGRLADDGRPTDADDGDAVPRPFCDREDANLRLCLTFEENAMDEAGAGVVIDVMNNLGFGPGKVGSAVQLTTSSAIHAAESPALDVTTALTMEVFAFVAQVPTTRAGFIDNNAERAPF